jgi:hypothetical protein
VSTVGRPLCSEGEGAEEAGEEESADGSTTSSAGAVIIIIIDTGPDGVLLGVIFKGSNVSGPKMSSVGLIKGLCMMGTVF